MAAAISTPHEIFRTLRSDVQGFLREHVSPEAPHQGLAFLGPQDQVEKIGTLHRYALPISSEYPQLQQGQSLVASIYEGEEYRIYAVYSKEHIEQMKAKADHSLEWSMLQIEDAMLATISTTTEVVERTVFDIDAAFVAGAMHGWQLATRAVTWLCGGSDDGKKNK